MASLARIVASTCAAVSLCAFAAAAAHVEGVRYTFWTFGGTAPGSFIRIRQRDTVEFHLKNHPGSMFYASCEFVCPMLMDAIQATQRKLKDRRATPARRPLAARTSELGRADPAFVKAVKSAIAAPRN